LVLFGVAQGAGNNIARSLGGALIVLLVPMSTAEWAVACTFVEFADEQDWRACWLGAVAVPLFLLCLTPVLAIFWLWVEVRVAGAVQGFLTLVTIGSRATFMLWLAVVTGPLVPVTMLGGG
jgi:hypothetical protein